jgi:hypothetical protein
MTAPREPARRNSPLRGSLRRFTLGTGPLKRRSDRLQVLGRSAVVLSLLLSPPLAVAAATATSTHLQAVAEAERAERTPTTARLLEDAGAPVPGENIKVQVRAEWTTDGVGTREGLVLAEPGADAGTELPIWVDRAGDPTRAPLDRAAVQTSALAVGLLPLIGVPVATWTLYAALCFVLDGRRDRRWTEEWAAVEPEWHSRLI